MVLRKRSRVVNMSDFPKIIYMPYTYDSKNSSILKISLTNLRLDISSRSATKKKPGTKYSAFLFSDRAELAQARDENKKAEAARSTVWLFLC